MVLIAQHEVRVCKLVQEFEKLVQEKDARVVNVADALVEAAQIHLEQVGKKMELETLAKGCHERFDLSVPLQVGSHRQDFVEIHEKVCQEVELKVSCWQHPQQVLQRSQHFRRNKLWAGI